MAPPVHFCPGCGAQKKSFPRYPWHFCNDCRKTATDGDGVALEFQNASMSGGLQWRRVGDEDWCTDHLVVLCRISGRPVYVREARFGGIVAEPIPDGPMRKLADARTCDLRRKSRT